MERHKSNAKWFKPVPFPPWYKRLSNQFRQFFKQQFLIDIIFHCDSGQCIGAHQTLLCHASPLLHQIISTAKESFNEDNIVHISVPNVSLEYMSDFLEALYLGAVPTDFNSFQECEKLADNFGLFQTFQNEHEDSVVSNVVAADDKSATETEEALEVPSVEENTESQEIEEEEDPVVNFLKTDDGIEVFVMEENAAAYQKTTGNKSNFNYHCEDIELQSLAPKEVNVIKKLQFQRCTLCGENAVEHRLEIHCEEDKHRLGIPIVPANENLKFLYRCCVQGCPFHTIRHLRHAAAFHVHMQKHDTGSRESSRDSVKKCPLCNKAKTLHINATQDLGVRRRGHIYKCCKCSASKLNAKKFFEHTQNHISKKFTCSICQKGFSQQRILDNHVYMEHGEGKGQRFHCNYEHCNFDAKYPQTLATHIKEKHEGEKRSHQADDSKAEVTCNVCGKTLKKWYYQLYHKDSCSTNVVYKCDICGQEGFVNNITLQNHVKAKHTTEKPYQCEHCDARYATSMSLSSHRSRVHRVNKAGEPVEQKLFACDYCGKLLTGKNKRDFHIKTVHERTRDFACKFCDKMFTTNANLKVHEAAIHTRDLPFKCDFCGKGFIRKKAWKDHMDKCGQVVQAAKKEQYVVVANSNPSPYISTMTDIIME